ncbi:MAG: PQQ-binding-like beta-propeller repeat protein [Planctomycetota bacterium]
MCTAALTLVLGSLASPALPHAQEAAWPAWRGPSGNGLAAADAQPPLTFSEEHNVRWRVELPGLGASTPVVLGDRLYLTCGLPESGAKIEGGEVPRPPREPHRLLVLAYDRATGEELWRTQVVDAAPHEKLHATSSLASASMSTDGQRLFASFGSHGIYALDLDGEVLWSRDLGRMTTAAEFGEGATPLLASGLVVVPWDHEGQSALIALDAESGEERWRRPRDCDSSWGSPALAPGSDGAHVIASGSDATHAYALADGEPSWSQGGMSKNPVNSPTVVGDLVYVLNSYKGNVIQALRSETGEVAWSYSKAASYVPNPIVVDGLFFFLRNSGGVLNCLDAATGEEHFAGERLDGVRTIHASPVAAAGRLYFASREGTVVVLRAGSEFEQLANNELDDCFDASPVIVGDELFLRGRRYLYCLREEAEQDG